MALPAAAAAIGAAGANTVGGVITNLVNINQAKKERMHQQRLAEYSYSKDLEMWEKQNEYNNPKNQMSRLSDAGLNPNLVYGNQTVSGNTSSQLPKYQRYETPYASISMESILPMLNQFQDLKQRQAQTDLIKQEVISRDILNEHLGSQTLYKTQKMGYDVAKSRWELGSRSSIAASPFGQKYQTSIRQTELNNQMKQLEMNLLKKGIHKGDNILLRMFIQNGLFDSLKNYIQKKF